MLSYRRGAALGGCRRWQRGGGSMDAAATRSGLAKTDLYFIKSPHINETSALLVA